MYALKHLDLFEELEKTLFDTFKYCYTKDTLINQYLLLSSVYEKKKMYREATYILYLISVSYGDYEKFLPEISRIEKITNNKYECPDYDTLMSFLKDKNIMTPYDLSAYYFNFYNDSMNNNDQLGALDFLKCSNNVCYDKRNIKLIRKLTKALDKAKKKEK